MFDKVKQLNKLRQESKRLEQELAKQVLEVSHKGVRIRVSGNMRLKSLDSAGQDDAVVLEAINVALKQAQKSAAKAMQGQLSSLQGLLG